jgi:hypothetical protein
MEKRCFKCLCVKPIGSFYKHARMADGHLNKCKECTKDDAAAHRQLNLERVRQYDRMRAAMPHRIALSKRVQAEWRAANPERRAAHVALGNAVRRGALKPWPICAVPECGKPPEAHHPDYSNPLSVVWLCVPHHRAAHAASE